MRSVVGAFCPGCLRDPLLLFAERDFELLGEPFDVLAPGAFLALGIVVE
jgi:hypothetical protein